MLVRLRPGWTEEGEGKEFGSSHFGFEEIQNWLTSSDYDDVHIKSLGIFFVSFASFCVGTTLMSNKCCWTQQPNCNSCSLVLFSYVTRYTQQMLQGNKKGKENIIIIGRGGENPECEPLQQQHH